MEVSDKEFLVLVGIGCETCSGEYITMNWMALSRANSNNDRHPTMNISIRMKRFSVDCGIGKSMPLKLRHLKARTIIVGNCFPRVDRRSVCLI